MLTPIAPASLATLGFAGEYLEIPANPTNLKLTPLDPASCKCKPCRHGHGHHHHHHHHHHGRHGHYD